MNPYHMYNVKPKHSLIKSLKTFSSPKCNSQASKFIICVIKAIPII